MDRQLTLKVVLYREHPRLSEIDRVRQLVLGHDTTLEGIFTRACESFQRIETITDDREYAEYLRIEENGALIALAMLIHINGDTSPFPYDVQWMREPDEATVAQWQESIQNLLDKSFAFDGKETTVQHESAKLKISLLYNLMHTREFAHPTRDIYPALYAVESRMGLQYARKAHIEEDFGL